MNKKKDGGPAYPSKIENHSTKAMKGFNGESVEPKTFSAYPGMTLRDYFAAKATNDDVNEVRRNHFEQNHGSPYFKVLNWVEAKYMHADAMLAERAK